MTVKWRAVHRDREGGYKIYTNWQLTRDDAKRIAIEREWDGWHLQQQQSMDWNYDD